MGRLINIDEIKDTSWYFTDECYRYNDSGTGRYLIWPNQSYPYWAAIFYKEIKDRKIKIEIRKWIESSIHDTVILGDINKSYRVYYGDKKIEDDRLPYDMWDKSYDVDLKWTIFYFENEESLLAFKLRFGDLISEIIERRPEDLDKITEDRRC